jgi:hypothetical protein
LPRSVFQIDRADERICFHVASLTG